MNLSGPRVADDINLDEFERRLRAAGAQQSGVEDPLSELARLLETSRIGAPSGATHEAPVVEVKEAEYARSAPPIDIEALRSSIEEPGEDLTPADSEADREARSVFEEPIRPSADNLADAAPRGRPWRLRAALLAIAGVAMIGAVVALKGRMPGGPKNPPFIAAAQGPTKVQPPSDQTVASPNDSGASVLKDNSSSANVKVVNSEEQPVDLNAQASLANSPPASTGAVGGAPMAAPNDTPVVPPAQIAPPTMAAQFPDPKPVRTVSLRPDGTPIASIAPPQAADQGGSPAAAPAGPAAPAQAPAANGADAGAAAQPSTPKIELPTKLSGKSAARVVDGKGDGAGAEAGAQTPDEPAQGTSPAKPEKASRKAKAAQMAEAESAPPAAPAAAAPVDAATGSGGWAVQLAAPRSEAEAKTQITRLNDKYASALNGATLGVHKAVVNGDTIYRLRVVGLTKADAAALCARLKGDGGQCFIAK
jgi:hypothetical protein